MRKIIDFFVSEKGQCILRAISIVVILFILYYYLLNADLSTAPEFIYNQF